MIRRILQECNYTAREGLGAQACYNFDGVGAPANC